MLDEKAQRQFIVPPVSILLFRPAIEDPIGTKPLYPLRQMERLRRIWSGHPSVSNPFIVFVQYEPDKALVKQLTEGSLPFLIGSKEAKDS